MKRLWVLIGLALVSGAAHAASVPPLTGAWDPGSAQPTINQVIRNINTILSPMTGTTANPVSGSNLISLTPGSPGNPAVIGMQSGGDTNSSIQIKPSGTGDIVLFNATGDTGVLQFANAAAFVVAPGLGVCPGVDPDNPPFGVNGTITGYVPFKDWLGVMCAFPAC